MRHGEAVFINAISRANHESFVKGSMLEVRLCFNLSGIEVNRISEMFMPAH